MRTLLANGGQLYAGGRFTSGSGTALGRVGRWNGAGWDPLDGGVAGVGAVSVDQLLPDPADPGSRYAIGNLLEASGVTVSRLARFNGSSWALLVDLVPGVEGRVEVLFAAGSTLIVGARFSQAGGRAAGNLAR